MAETVFRLLVLCVVSLWSQLIEVTQQYITHLIIFVSRRL